MDDMEKILGHELAMLKAKMAEMANLLSLTDFGNIARRNNCLLPFYDAAIVQHLDAIGYVSLFRHPGSSLIGVMQSGLGAAYEIGVYRPDESGAEGSLSAIFRETDCMNEDIGLYKLNRMFEAQMQWTHDFRAVDYACACTVFPEDAFGGLIEAYRSTDGYMVTISLTDSVLGNGFLVSAFRDSDGLAQPVGSDWFESLHDARCAMSRVIESGCDFLDS